MHRVVIAAVLAASVSGCGVVVPILRSERQLERLRVGATRAEAESAIGRPSSTDMPIGNSQVTYHTLYAVEAAAENAVMGFATFTVTWWLPGFGGGHKRGHWLRYVDGRLAEWH